MLQERFCRSEFFNIYKSFFYEVFGDTAFKNFSDYLNTSLKLIFLQPNPDFSGIIQGRQLNTLFATTDIHIIPQVDDFLFELGRYFVHSPLFSSLKTEEQLYQKPTFNEDFSEEMDISYSNDEKGKLLKEFTDFSNNMKKWFQPFEIGLLPRGNNHNIYMFVGERVSPLPIFCDFIQGTFYGFCDKVGLSGFSVSEDKCIFNGYEQCTFKLSWQSQSILDF